MQCVKQFIAWRQFVKRAQMAPKDMPLHGVWAKPKKSVGEASVKAKVFGKSGKDEDGKGKYGDGFCKGKDGMPKKGGGEASVKGKGFGKDKDGKGKYGKGFCEGQHGKGGKGKGNTAKAKETMEQYNARHKALDEKRAAVLWSQASEASEERSLPKATLGPSVIDEGKGEDSELAKADAKATPTTSRKIAPWKASQPAKDVDVYCGRCSRQFTHAFIKQAMIPVDCSRRWMYLASCFQPDCWLEEGGLPGKFITLQPAEEETFLCALASWGSWALIDNEGDDNPIRQSLEFLRRQMHPVPRAVTTEHAKDDSGARASTDEPWKAHILIAERHQAERAARQQAERAREVNGEEMGNKLAPVIQRSALAAAHGPSAPVSGPKYPKRGNPPKLTGFPVATPKPPKHPPPPPPPQKRKRNSSPLTWTCSLWLYRTSFGL